MSALELHLSHFMQGFQSLSRLVSTKVTWNNNWKADRILGYRPEANEARPVSKTTDELCWIRFEAFQSALLTANPTQNQLWLNTTVSPDKTWMRIFVILCSFTSIMCGFSPGACDVLHIERALTWEAERTVSAHIQGNPINEHPNDNIPTTTRSRLYPGPFWSLCSFLLKRTPVISVSINNRIPTKIAGMMAAKIQPMDILLFIPPGLINHSRSLWVGRKPSVNGLLMETWGVITLSPRAKSTTAIKTMATTTLESLTSLLDWNENQAKLTLTTLKTLFGLAPISRYAWVGVVESLLRFVRCFFRGFTHEACLQHSYCFKNDFTHPFSKKVTCPELTHVESHKESSKNQDGGE